MTAKKSVAGQSAARMSGSRPNDGLSLARLLMVASSLSPLFLLLAVRGTALVPDRIFIPTCLAAIIIPYAVLGMRIILAARSHDRKTVEVVHAEDHRDHMLVYLLATLIPLYAIGLDSWRDVLAMSIAIALVIFVFWRLDLHYTNVIFAVLGYRVFTIYVKRSKDSEPAPMTLLTRRANLGSGQITGLRLSDMVYIEGA